MAEKYQLVNKVTEYNTSYEPSNAPETVLVAGSKNTIIDGMNGKVRSRNGYTRLGASNSAVTPVRNAWTWHTSTGTELAQRFYDDELEVYLGTVDATVINAWTRISSGWSTTEKLRPANWFDTTENLDLQIMVQGNANIYEYNGAVAVVASITGVTITKAGTDTFAQARFFTTRNKIVVCVRTGTEYTYTGGETTTTLTGIADTTGLVAGDILVQKIVTRSNAPAASRNNHTIFAFENQIYVGSEDDEEVYISKNSSYYDFAYSAPRLAGEGGLLTLDASSTGFASLGSYLLAFCGRSSIFRANYEQITVSTTLAETLRVKKLDTGVDQGAINQETIIPIGNALVYLSHEPALRIISSPDNLSGLNPRSLSNPIKADFDAEDFTDSFGIWFKNSIIINSSVNSIMYMLDTVEDAKGSLRRFWQPPQTLPAGPMSVIDNSLHIHSNSVPETYEMFTGYSDGMYDDMDVADKLAINAVAVFAYRNYGDRANLKNFDEYYTEGEISPSTDDLALTLDYDFGGHTQQIERIIDGTDLDILEETLANTALGQQPLGTQPLGGSMETPSDAAKFRVCFEIAKEDFHEMQTTFSTNSIDKFWSIIAHGCNAKMSARRNSVIHK